MKGISIPLANRSQRVKTYQITLFFILLVASLALYGGWWLFWFQCDDAYIAFRYVSNSLLGHGYTWNAPPFRPVEGYTSFLWVVLLDIVWRITGIEPPVSANSIALVFSFATTALGVIMLLTIKLNSHLEKHRQLFLVVFLFGVLTNRTYLAWASSGLETAMFNFFVTAWIYVCMFLPPRTPGWMGWMMGMAVLAGLTRPDGFLLLAASLFLSGLTLIGKLKNGRFRPMLLLPFTPMLFTIAHFLWRKNKYGEWLPNTYAAKVAVAWPESGLRYFLSFVMEYSLWFWFALILIVVLVKLRTVQPWNTIKKELFATPPSWFVALTVIGTLTAHIAYYILIVGGDHFEYRIFSHLILFIFLSSIWLLNQLEISAAKSLAFLSLFIFCSLPIPWTHWALTHQLTTRPETSALKVAVAPHFPRLIRPYVQVFDDLQFWLVEHLVGRRHQEHKIFSEDQFANYPSREEGFLLSSHNYPVIAIGTIGVPGWVLPTINIIDTLGLNDYVVARNPTDPTVMRYMAHERFAPNGYVECFHPNVKLVANNKLVVADHTLTSEMIVECESRPWPASQGVPEEESNLNITNENAPAMDRYLWDVWPNDPVYLNFMPPGQDSTHQNRALLEAFKGYNGLGCVVIPPWQPTTNPPDYLFAFLPANDRSTLSDLAARFPWAQIVTEQWVTSPTLYHLGYAAPMGSDLLIEPDVTETAVWDNGLQLLGYDLPRQQYKPGETLYLTLYWQATEAVAGTNSLFTHLLGAYNPTTNGPLWGQDDGSPCRDLYPMEWWQPGTIIVGKTAVSIPATAPPGEYQLITGFYNWMNGERIPVTAETGVQEGFSLPVIQVQP